MKRLFDIALALALMPFALPLMLLVALMVKTTSPGPVIHWSTRVGRHRVNFKMAKVRTMRIDTPQLPTHLMTDAKNYLTPVGGFLRKSSLDELPQLWNVLVGEMSFVGPRPALFNQDDLVAMREEKGINDLVPGVTGWAQINGRDEIDLSEKVALEADYLARRSLSFDLKIIWLTFLQALTGADVRH